MFYPHQLLRGAWYGMAWYGNMVPPPQLSYYNDANDANDADLALLTILARYSAGFIYIFIHHHQPSEITRGTSIPTSTDAHVTDQKYKDLIFYPTSTVRFGRSKRKREAVLPVDFTG